MITNKRAVFGPFSPRKILTLLFYRAKNQELKKGVCENEYSQLSWLQLYSAY